VASKWRARRIIRASSQAAGGCSPLTWGGEDALGFGLSLVCSGGGCGCCPAADEEGDDPDDVPSSPAVGGGGRHDAAAGCITLGNDGYDTRPVYSPDGERNDARARTDHTPLEPPTKSRAPPHPCFSWLSECLLL
jgi:hypothetical protein